MVKKVTRDLLILAGILIMAASTSRKAMEYISQARDTKAWWGEYQGKNGDLVNISYLDFVPRFCTIRDYAFRKQTYTLPKHVALYLHGDSYTEKIPDTAFTGIVSYQYGRRYSKNLVYKLDSTQKNILIIQVSERYVRKFFGNLDVYNRIYEARNTASAAAFSGKAHYAGLTVDALTDKLFNPNINQNLQYNLFNYNFLIPVMQYKAAFNYYVFGRASGDAVISKDGQRLFIRETTTTTDFGSSYITIPQESITDIVHNLNAIYQHYREAGFAEVYVSMIPNAATIMQPEGYNGLIPRVQNDTALKMKVIDVYTPYSQTKEIYYRPGDTHWNNKGLQVWLKMVNDTIAVWNKRATE